MALRFFAEFTSRGGNDWRVNLYDDEFSGIAAESNVGPPGFELEYFGGKDVYSPLMPSTCRVPLAIQTAAEEALLADLADFQEGRFMLEVQQLIGATYTRHWLGVMSPDSIKVPDAARPFFIGLDAVCGLSLLSRKEYDVAQQVSGTINNSGLDHLLNCVRSIPGATTTFWPLLSPMLSAPIDIRPNTGTASDNFLQDVFFQAATNDIFQGQNTVGTYEDMLVQICTMTNSRIFQRGGHWMLQPVSRQMGVSTILTDIQNFDRLGNLINTTGESGLRVTIDQVNRHRTDGFFSYLPAIRKISRTIDFFGNVPFAGDSQIALTDFANNGNTASSLPIGKTITGTADVTLPSTQSVRVTGFVRIFVPWFDGDVAGNYQPLERVQRFRLELQVKVGSKYLRRTAPHDLTFSTIEADELYTPPGESSSDVEIFNAGTLGAYQWTTDSTARVQFWSDYVITGADDFQFFARNTAINFDFESPEIGSAEQADVQLTATFTGYHGQATAGNPDAFVSESVKVAGCFARGDFNVFLGDGSASADAITFGAELDNGATEELTLPVGLYGEVSSADIYIYNPAALLAANFVSIPNFTSSTTTDGTPLAELVCVDRMQHFGKVQKAWQGTIYSDDVLSPMNLLLFDSATWLMTQISFSADLDDFEVECTQVAELGTLDPDSVDTVRRVGATQPPVGSTNDVMREQVGRAAISRSDLSEQIADVETDVANVTRTSGAGGGESSVQLSYLGDVKISSPTAGQVIEYNSIAGRWANVTPSAGGVSYHDRYSTEAEAERSGATANVELYYTARADGDGFAESPTSDSGVTDTINRTLYFSDKFEADPDTAADWTEYTTQPADNATFATAKAALLLGLNETDGTANTRGTLPLSIKIVRTTTAAANLLLDIYTNAAAAFSIRKLRTAYTGSCLRVVRQNDGSEQDIGFDSNGLLDVAAIATFCGTASGKVSIFYDQSGNGDNAVQPTGQRQPDIYNGSGVYYVNSKPALSFVRSSLESLKIDNSGLDIGTLTSMCVMRFNSTTSGQVGLSLSGNSTSYPNKRWYAPYYSGNGAFFYYFHGATNVSTSADQNQHLHSMIKRPSYNAAPSLDGTALSTISSTATGVDLATDVGLCFWNNSFNADANQQEVIYWSSDQTSNRAGIESNIMTFYGIT